MRLVFTYLYVVFVSIINISCLDNGQVEIVGKTKDFKKTYTETTDAPGVLSVMSYNILWDKTTTGDTQWYQRKGAMIDLLKRHNPDVISIQEGFLNQINDINSELNYAWFGFGTEDGKTESEGPKNAQSLNPILYNADKLVLQEKGAFWFSPTPDVASKGDDIHYRNAVWGKFKENVENGETVYIFNTHFGLTDTYREEQALLLMSKIDEIAGANAKVIIAGDFNSDPGRDRSYQVITNTLNPLGLVNTKDICVTSLIGPAGTGVGLEVGLKIGYLIDHIFVRNIGYSKVHKVIDDYEGRYYPSDHLPVLAILPLTD